MKRNWIATIGFALLTAAGAASAQPEPITVISTASTDSLTFASVSNHVRAGSKIRVYTTTAPGSPLVLRGRDLLPSGIRTPLAENPSRGSPGTRTLPWADVREVQVKGSASTTGGIVGALLFGAGGAAIGFAISKDEFFNSDNSIGGEEVLMGAAISAMVGALVGAGIGSLIHKWKTVHPK